MSDLTPGFMVLHGNRMEDLRDLLLDWLARYPLPPLSPEVMLVQSNGMKQWLVQSLALRLGVCAATQVMLPGEFLWQAYRAVLGKKLVPDQMPFDKDALVWRLMRLLPLLCDGSNQVYAPLTRYLAEDDDPARLYGLTQQVADVFDQYQNYRADWLDDWKQGQDVLRLASGECVPMAPTQCWQPALWRALLADVASSSKMSVLGEGLWSRDQVHQAFSQALQGGQLAEPDRLPARVVVFGVSSLPMQSIEALSLLGQVCQVILCAHNPCQYYWGDVVEARVAVRAAQQRARRQAHKPGWDGLAPEVQAAQANPLLAAWGRQGRDYLHLLDQFDAVEQYSRLFARVDVFEAPQGETLLAQVQRAVLNLDGLPDVPPALPVVDDSMVFRSGYSPQREVEMLHDHLLALFAGNDGICPRDVMVMVPDMAVFAPHIQAVFGRFGSDEARYIPYSLADASVRSEPVVQVLERLLRLPELALGLSDWQAMFEVASVRARFELSADEVALLYEWLLEAGVRWGLDASHREAQGMPAGLNQNSWCFGIQRMLLGYAVGEGEVWQSVAPYGAVGGLDARLVGQLSLWLDAVRWALEVLVQSRSPSEWQLVLLALIERFLDVSGDAAATLRKARLEEALDDWLKLCQAADFGQEVSLAVVREQWLSALDQPSLGQPFLGAGVQFATLMPMRSIPFQVVCLLGMNDGDYPRVQMRMDFDLMADGQVSRAGDRSRREDDRYLFLEALLSARRQLYVSWVGRDVRDDGVRAPSVLVTQLMRYLQQGWGWQPAQSVVQHPLQPFSRQYFAADSPLRSFDDDWARVHEGGEQSVEPPLSLPEEPLPERVDEGCLYRLLRQPVEVFYRNRLQVKLDTPDEVLGDEEPFVLDGLGQHQLLSAVLDSSLGIPTPEQLQMAWQGQQLAGRLPVGVFGQQVQQDLTQSVQAMADDLSAVLARFDAVLPVQTVSLLVAGVQVQAGVPGLRAAGDEWLQVLLVPGMLKDKKGKQENGHRLLRGWLRHVLGCAAGWSLTTRVVGVDASVCWQPLPVNEALALLQSWLDLYAQALQRPLPVACKAGCAYVQEWYKQQGELLKQGELDEADRQTACVQAGLSGAKKVFEDGHQRDGERSQSPYLSLAFAGFEALEDELPQLAMRLYGDMLARVGGCEGG